MAAVRLLMPGAVASSQAGGHLGAGGGLHPQRDAGEEGMGADHEVVVAPAAGGDAAVMGNNRKLARKLEEVAALAKPVMMQHLAQLRDCSGVSAAKRQRCGSSGGRVEDDVSPQEYLQRILYERGYETELIPATLQPFFRPPHDKQIEDYDMNLVGAVKRGDIETLRQLADTGRRMDACNKHGESIVHISCRRGNVEILRFLLDHGARVDICDDLGRTPLHDACWAKDPVFECVTAILERDLRLLRISDCRGASPLAYIKRDHWPAWRQFFDMKKEQYWAYRNAPARQASGARAEAGESGSRGSRPHPCEGDVANGPSSPSA